MVCRVQRNPIGLDRKLQVLRDLTGSKSVRKKSILMDAFDYIQQLKLQVDALNKQYLTLLNRNQLPPDDQVKVEKINNNGFLVRVNCKKARDLLVTILESFEEKGLNVLHARVCCNQSTFCMEAITETQNTTLDVRDVTEFVFKVLKTKIGDENIS